MIRILTFSSVLISIDGGDDDDVCSTSILRGISYVLSSVVEYSFSDTSGTGSLNGSS